MVAVKKTPIRIKNMDDPIVRRASQKAGSTFDFDDDFDVAKDMRHKLAGTDRVNRIDLNNENDDDEKIRKPEKMEDSINLKKKPEIDLNDVASRMRDRINSVLGRDEETSDDNNKVEEEKDDFMDVQELIEPEKVVKKRGRKSKTTLIETSKEAVDIFAESNAVVCTNEKKDGPCVIDEKIKNDKHKVSLRLYRNIAIFFVLGTLMLLSAVFYFTAVKLTINITPRKEMINENLPFEVADLSRESTGANINSVAGVVEATTISETKRFPSTGENITGEDVVGKITLVNNYVKNQPLVATTRLMTSDGKLFRLKDTVNVPAGGSVEASVYADKPMPDIEVAPTRFVIPGLWVGIQDKIYGESKETIKYQQQTERYLQSSDIDTAVASLKQQLIQEAKSKIGDMYKNYKQVLYKVDDGSVTQLTTSKVGDKVEDFEITVKASVGVVAFNDEAIVKMAKEKLVTSVPVNKELTDFSEQSIYNLDNLNLVEKTANVNANFSGMATINANSNIIDKEKIVGISEGQLKSYLSDIKEISDYKLSFYPGWWSSVPKLVDRITVNVVK